uniref:Reverse transcriptase domain-containing protein n=1 Tax=Sander lucioperca TaxID=283035 RepID=A0A8C9X1G9_SANLU
MSPPTTQIQHSIKSNSSSISLFADDILLYISDLEDSIPKILKIFNEFGSISGYKINWNKYNLLLNNRHVTSAIMTEVFILKTN